MDADARAPPAGARRRNTRLLNSVSHQYGIKFHIYRVLRIASEARYT